MTTLPYAIQTIQDEAEAILQLIPQLDQSFDDAIQLILNCKGKVILTGVGKSGHIAAKIAATLASTGTPSFYINPLDLYHGDLGVITANDTLIAISNSGLTDELLRFIPMLQQHAHTPIIAITGNPGSLLAKYADIHIHVSVSKEACPLNLAPTSSTTAQLVIGDAIAIALMQCRHFKPADFAQFHPGGELGKRLLTTAGDIMRTNDLPTVPPEMHLGEAVIHVSKGKLGLAVAVAQEPSPQDETQRGPKVLGIITDGDIRRAMERWNAQFFDHTVSDIMTTTPKSVLPTTKITEVQRIMQKHLVHSVLVVDSDNRLLGVLDHYTCML